MQRGEIEALLDRVRAAEGPDREIDREICIGFDVSAAEDDGPAGWEKSPLYTEKVDDALGLISRQSHMAVHDIHGGRLGWTITLCVPDHADEYVEADHDLLPLALCAAFLLAKLSLTGADK